jgi:hypothetical protein
MKEMELRERLIRLRPHISAQKHAADAQIAHRFRTGFMPVNAQKSLGRTSIPMSIAM